jgi:hypothetical protein
MLFYAQTTSIKAWGVKRGIVTLQSVYFSSSIGTRSGSRESDNG